MFFSRQAKSREASVERSRCRGEVAKMQRSRRSKRATPKVALKALPAARPKTKKRGRASTSGSKGSEVIQIDDEGPSQKSQLNGDGYDREKEGRDYKKRIREMEKLATNPDLETKFKLVSTMVRFDFPRSRSRLVSLPC